MPTWIRAVLAVPAVLAFGVACFVGFLGPAMRTTGRLERGDGPMIAAAALVTLALHAGYVLAPFWVGTERSSIALWLTVPLAFFALFVVLADGSLRNGLILCKGPRTNADPKMRFILAWGLVLGYGTTPVMLVLTR